VFVTTLIRKQNSSYINTRKLKLRVFRYRQRHPN